MELTEVPQPELGSHEVMVRVEAVGICGSELSGYLGHNSLRVPPLIMGHEFAGQVAAVGSSVKQLREGTRVAVNPLVTCGECQACRRGLANLCEQRALLGAHRPGAFAEYVAVPEAACLQLPSDIDATTGAMAEPVACAVRAVRLGEVRLGAGVLIIGAGTIGLLCATLALRAGAAWVAISDTNPARLAVARQWGIERTIDASRGSVSEALRGQIDSYGADVVIDAVGLTATRREALASACRGGQVVFVGLHQAEVSFDGNDLVRNEQHITGCFAYAPDDFETAAALLAAGFLPERDAWMEVRSLDKGPTSFEELISSQPEVVKIMLTP